MRITWDLLDQLSDEYGMDINDMLNLLGDPLTDESGEDYWDYPDSDGNSIPDILESLINEPITTNPSQGGALG